MRSVIFGILLIAIGIVAILIKGSNGIITGAFVAGIISLIGGIHGIKVKKKRRKHETRLDQVMEDILFRMVEKEETISKIATFYYKSEKIPPVRTILHVSYKIALLFFSEDNTVVEDASNLVALQLSNSNTDPEKFIEFFNSDENVFGYTSDMMLYTNDPVSSKFTRGTLLINKGFIYFFPFVQNSSNKTEKDYTGDLISNTGLFMDLFSGASKLATGLVDEFKKDFDEEVIKELKDRFNSEKSILIPLFQIKDIERKEIEVDRINRYFLYVSGSSLKEEWQYYFRLSSNYPWRQRNWTKAWRTVIDLVCISEGHLISRTIWDKD